jgi:hypothetical protein
MDSSSGERSVSVRREGFEVRICIRPLPGGKVELSTWTPITRREVRTGLKAGPGQAHIDYAVEKLKRALEMAGNWVTVVNLDRNW